MPAPDMTRRLSAKILDKDIDSLNGLGTVENYVAACSDALSTSLQQCYTEMLTLRQKETEMAVLHKAATDACRQAEWRFHNCVMSMKESVRAQFGPDSNEAQAIGYKKKSERKRPRRHNGEVKEA
ncbi:MAG: hypothetical protein VKK04_01870 [Synechococcales bacterium]|nr:hypothetical protein [Synechococcales bacterium]